MTDEPELLTGELVDVGVADLVDAIRDLIVAVSPALTPARRPTWNQQRWAPTPEGFGDLEVSPLAAVDAGGWPTTVAPDQLIESAWGNAVVNPGVRYAPVGMGQARVAPHVQGAIGAVLNVPVTPTVNYATRMFVQSTVWAGSDSSTLAAVTGATIAAVGGAANQPTTPPSATTPGGGMYAMVTLNWSWAVPANTDPTYAVHAQWTTGTGTIYTACDTTWQRFRA